MTETPRRREINRNDFADRLADSFDGFTQTQAREVLAAAIDLIFAEIGRGVTVHFRELGRFGTVTKRSGERTVSFIPSQAAPRRLNSLRTRPKRPYRRKAAQNPVGAPLSG